MPTVEKLLPGTIDLQTNPGKAPRSIVQPFSYRVPLAYPPTLVWLVHESRRTYGFVREDLKRRTTYTLRGSATIQKT